MRTPLFLILILALAACDEATNTPAKDGAPPADSGVDQTALDGPTVDMATPDMAAHDSAAPDVMILDTGAPDAYPLEGGAADSTLPDLSPPDMYFSDFTPPKAVLQTVMSKIKLPTNTTTSQLYSFDLDGNGTKDNGLGTVLGLVSMLGGTVDLEAMVNADIKVGKLLYLLEVLGTALTSSSPVWVQLHKGADTDNKANNNLTGTGKLKVAFGSPLGSYLKGVLTTGQLNAGPNQVVAPLPMGAGSAVMVTMKLARLSGKVSSSGIISGVLGGAIPMLEIHSKVVPAVAAVMDRFYKDPLTDASTKALLKSLFDTNGDGTITGKELSANILVMSFLTADLDTDGDKVKDALSIGFGFTAVSCQIQ